MSKNSKKGIVPRLRFPEFKNAGEWETFVFKNVFDRLTTKNTENNQNVLTISAQKGLVSQLDYFNKKISSNNLLGYYLICKGDFAYNKSYSQGYPFGAIKLLREYDKGIVSSLYICFRAKPGFNRYFYEQYFEAGLLNCDIEAIAEEGARNHGLLNIGISDFFEKVSVLAPGKKEQQKIADCLSSLDDVITAQSEKVEALKNYKKGILQQLFPQDGQTTPSLRFPEFKNAGEWEYKTLGEFLKTDIREVEKPKSNYLGLGIRSHGKGTFLKYDEDPKKNSMDYLFEVKADDLIVSITFAWEGAIAIATDEDEGALVSHRFPTYTFMKEKIERDFFRYIIISKQFVYNLGLISPGGAGRNRVMSKGDFLNLKVLLPNIDEQKKIASCLTSLDQVISSQSSYLENLKLHKKGLLQRLFPIVESKGE